MGDRMYFVARNGERYGPYELKPLVAFIKSGTVSLSDVAWFEGLADWSQLVFLIDFPAEARILLSRDGTNYGPYTPAELVSFLREGSIHLNDKAWTHGLGEWRPLANVLAYSLR